jgi:chitinase
MKVVRMFAALLLLSSALYTAPISMAGPTSGAVVVNAGGARAQDGSDTVPAGTTGTIVAGPKTVNGVVYVNVMWNGTAAFQANYNGWVADASLSAAGTTTTPPPTTPPPTTPPPTTPPPTTPPPTTPPPTTPPPTPTGLKIIGYYPRYAIEDGFYPKNLVTKGTASHLTHINFAFANIVGNKCASFNTADDYTTKVSAANSVSGVADTSGSLAGTFHQFQELKAKYPSLKIIVSIGGGSVNPSVIASAANASNRAAFVQSCINMYIKGNFGGGITGAGIFDGFDIDWEFPASATDRSNFTGLLSEFRSQLDAVKPGYTLSIAGPNGQWAWQYIDLVTVQKYLTFVNIMTYDYAGPWNNETGLVSPLYRSSNDPSPTDNGSSSVEGYEAAGMPASKLTFGVPFYGYEWGNVANHDNGLFEPGSPANQGANATTIVAAEPKFKQYRDSISQSPYLFDGSHFWTYEDTTSIKFKMAYVKNQQLAGVMIWNLEQDLSDGTLFNAVASGLASSN